MQVGEEKAGMHMGTGAAATCQLQARGHLRGTRPGGKKGWPQGLQRAAAGRPSGFGVF